jgi:3-oxoacyl-[acyl-carrier-protein] synthase-1
MNENGTINIVGVGARTPVGLAAPTSAAAVRAGINRIGEHHYMIDKAGEPMIVARAAYISDEVRGVERFAELAWPAVQEALAPLSRLAGTLPPIPFITGLPAPRPGLPKNLAEEFANRLQSLSNQFRQFSEIATISCGHSAGLMAIEEGCRRIRNENIEFCFAGGVDSYLEPETLEWLDEEEQLHSEKNKWGFAPGEGAGFCLLASSRAVEKYRLAALGKVLAAATAKETNLIKTASVCVGEGLTKAFKQVLPVLAAPEQKVDQTVCDMNGERYRADEYGFTTVRTSEYFAEPGNFLAPADRWGDVGAASGPLFVNLAVYAGLRKYAKGPMTLVWTSSEGGERAAALIEVKPARRTEKAA